MEDFYLILRLIFFVWILFLPQFLGVLVHYRIKKFPTLAYFVGFILTTILSFFLLLAISPKPSQEKFDGCSLCIFAMLIFPVSFTFLQIIVSVIIQSCLAIQTNLVKIKNKE